MASIRGRGRPRDAGRAGMAPTSSSSPIPRSSQTIPSWVAMLFFYNTVSVLVALVAMLAVNSAATHAIARYYQRQAEEMSMAWVKSPSSTRPAAWVRALTGWSSFFSWQRGKKI